MRDQAGEWRMGGVSGGWVAGEQVSGGWAGDKRVNRGQAGGTSRQSEDRLGASG